MPHCSGLSGLKLIKDTKGLISAGWDRALYCPGGHRAATFRGWDQRQPGGVAGWDKLLCHLPWPGPCLGAWCHWAGIGITEQELMSLSRNWYHWAGIYITQQKLVSLTRNWYHWAGIDMTDQELIPLSRNFSPCLQLAQQTHKPSVLCLRRFSTGSSP